MMKTEDPRGQMCDDVRVIFYYGEVLKTCFYALFERPPYNTRAAEAIAVDVVRDVLAMKHTVFVTKNGDRCSVRVSADDDPSHGGIRHDLFDMRLDCFPDAKKTSVGEPYGIHLFVWFGWEVEVVPPVGLSVR